MKKAVIFTGLLFIFGVLSMSGCKKDEKAGTTGQEGTSQTQPSEPAPVPEGTPKY